MRVDLAKQGHACSGFDSWSALLKSRVATLDNPRDIGEALSGAKLGNYWKYRVGDWRIICDIQDRRIVVPVLWIENRREIYR